ncbi:MAG TPA: helix-turn-helix domain-containing protein [Blastocatellia bacterium]
MGGTKSGLIKKEMVTTVTAADRLGISRKRVFQLIQEGRLQATQYGRSWLIPLAEVEKYERERKPAGRPSMKQQKKS